MSNRGLARGGRRRHASKDETQEVGKRRWHTAQAMPTAKAQADQNRQKTLTEATEEYLRDPPEDEVLFEVCSTSIHIMVLFVF